MIKFNLGRQRRFIQTRYESLVSLLSWRYAGMFPGKEPARARQDFRELLDKQSKLVSFQSLCAGLQATHRFHFAPKIDNVTVLARSHKSVEAEELRLLDGLLDLLHYARFHPLSESEERFATKESYRFSSSVSVKWKAYSDGLLSKRTGKVYVARDRPVSADRAWFFHRGVGLERRRGFFFTEKVNELLRRGSARLLERTAQSTQSVKSATNNSVFITKLNERIRDGAKALRIIMNRLRGKESTTPLTNVAIPELSSQMDETGTVANRPVSIKVSEVKNNHTDKPAEVFDHTLEKALRDRQTLADYNLNTWNFLKRVTLQEPAYKDVVVVYRKVDLESSSIAPGEYSNEARYNQQLLAGNPMNINIRVFRDVPMSDIELLLPDKRVFLANSDLLQFGAMLTILAVTSSEVLVMSSSKAWLLAFVASGSYLLRVLSRMYASWAYYTTLTDTVLGDHIIAHGPPALGWLGVLAEDQLKKEMAIIYLSLIELGQKHGDKELSLEAVVAQCRLIVRSTLGENVLFEPTEAINALTKEGEIEQRVDDAGTTWYKLPPGKLV